MSHRHATALRAGATSIIAALGIFLVAGASPAARGENARMRAIVQSGSGGPEVLAMRDVPVLTPKAGEVLIRVYAAGVNPSDWKARVEIVPGLTSNVTGERIPGIDIAGVVAKTGPNVRSVAVGSPVFALLDRSGLRHELNGGYAEYAIAPAGNVVAKPPQLTYAQAAGLGTIADTAARVVNETGLSAGQSVLILGVAGGVGGAVAQIAKARGAYVIGTASSRHFEYLRSIGVDQVIDYTTTPFEQQAHDVDVVIDTVGGEYPARALKTLKPGGILITLAGFVEPQLCARSQIRCPNGRGRGPGPPAAYSDGELLTQVAELVKAGRFVVHVDRTFALAEAGDAQEYSRGNHAEGKIVLIVDPEHASSN